MDDGVDRMDNIQVAAQRWSLPQWAVAADSPVSISGARPRHGRSGGCTPRCAQQGLCVEPARLNLTDAGFPHVAAS